MRRCRRFEIVVGILACAGAAVRAAAGPLDRTALDKEITLEMKGADIAEVFRQMAHRTGEVFVLDFEPDPSLALSFNAKNLSARSLLASIGGPYGLKYVDGGDHIKVQRSGTRPAPRPLRVEDTPENRPPLYDLRFAVRTAGHVLSTPRVTTGLNQVAEVHQTVQVRTAAAGLGEPSSIKVKVTPTRATESALELLVDGSSSRKVAPTRTVTHRVEDTVTAAAGETVLFSTDDGYEMVLTEWRTIYSPSRTYELQLQVRSGTGEVLSTPRVTTRFDEDCEVKWGSPTAPDGLTEFKARVVGETGTEIELAVESEVKVRSPRGAYNVQAMRRRVIAGPGETVLFDGRGGQQLVLTRWGRLERRQ